MKTYVHTMSNIQMYIAALFIIIEVEIQMSINQINKMWYIYIILFSNKHKPLINSTIWMNFKNIMLSEKSQMKKGSFWKEKF